MEKLKSHKCFNGTVNFWKHSSDMTKTEMKFSSFLPSGTPKGALIWLSGLTCNEENFITKAGAQKYLEEHNLAVFCPDTSPRGLDLPGEHDAYDFGSGAGFYLDASVDGYKDHYKMYSYIADEFYGLIQKEFGFSDNISIFGHSMGGHGAMTIGLKNPQKFKSISAFSPIVNPIECDWGKKAFNGYLGADESLWKSYDTCELIKAGFKHKNSILVDQGLEDDFFKNQLLTANLESVGKECGQGLKVHYRDGYDHSYYFISTFVESHIQFHASKLV